jgi:hypothetical protein
MHFYAHFMSENIMGMPQEVAWDGGMDGVVLNFMLHSILKTVHLPAL